MPWHVSETVLFCRETAVLHRCIVSAEGIVDAALVGKEVLHETRGLPRSNAKQVMHHQHLAIAFRAGADADHRDADGGDRKSTRLNSSHVKISYAVFCLKKK